MTKSKELVNFFESMLSRQEFLIPIVAASYQYPNHYYGMTSAALLEDLFVDASSNYRNMYRPDIDFSRPSEEIQNDLGNSKGEKGWDYRFQGEHFSHKVGQKVQDIALIWDATIQLPPNGKMSYESSMVFVLSNYRAKKCTLIGSSGVSLEVTAAKWFREEPLVKDQVIIIAERLSTKEWKMIELIKLTSASFTISQALDFQTLWSKIIGYWKDGDANSVDIFITTKPVAGDLPIRVGESVDMSWETQPGVYIFDKENLQDIEVKKNNRGVLLPTKRTLELCKEAANQNLFVFMPTWYVSYAVDRPADLYLAQKQEFDQLSSPHRNREFN
jgi:hypothetical protein